MGKIRFFRNRTSAYALIFMHDRIKLIPLFFDKPPHSSSPTTEYVFNNHECIGQTIFNPSGIARWLHAQKPGPGTPIIIVLDEPYLHELILSTTEYETAQEKPGETSSALLPHYVYSREHIIDDRWYVAGMPAHMRFQLSLILQRASYHMCGITTHTLIRAHTPATDAHKRASCISIDTFKKTITPEHNRAYMEGLYAQAQKLLEAHKK